MTSSENLQGKTVRLARDRRRKWRVVKDDGLMLTIVNGQNFEAIRKRVRRKDVVA